MAQILQAAQPTLGGLLASIEDVWSKVWWVALPIIAFFIFWDFWMMYIRFMFVSDIKWQLLEIKIPKNVLKTPKAMEQIFAAAHGPYTYGMKPVEIYWEGKVEYWMSFELVGSAGETHFYLRVPRQYRNSMESAIYAQYPEAEITEAEDYVRKMPKVLPNKTLDVFGLEMILKFPDCYPIRSYMAFEESVEERRVDPIAMLMEIMSKLKGDEQIWIQILARPTGDDWKKEGDAIIAKLTGRKEEKKSSWFPGFGITWEEIFRAPFQHPSMEAKKKSDDSTANFRMLMLTPGQREIIESIEKKTAKLGFQSTIRFLYIDKRESFSRETPSAIMGYFRQFYTQNLNMFRPDKRTMTLGIRGLFKNMKLNWRKRLVYERYRDLIHNERKSVFNVEELATLYHYPIFGVESTSLEKVESRRGSAPMSLPIIED